MAYLTLTIWLVILSNIAVTGESIRVLVDWLYLTVLLECILYLTMATPLLNAIDSIYSVVYVNAFIHNAERYRVHFTQC